jgi:hypothetical protein
MCCLMRLYRMSLSGKLVTRATPAKKLVLRASDMAKDQLAGHLVQRLLRRDLDNAGGAVGAAVVAPAAAESSVAATAALAGAGTLALASLSPQEMVGMLNKANGACSTIRGVLLAPEEAGHVAGISPDLIDKLLRRHAVASVSELPPRVQALVVQEKLLELEQLERIRDAAAAASGSRRSSAASLPAQAQAGGVARVVPMPQLDAVAAPVEADDDDDMQGGPDGGGGGDAAAGRGSSRGGGDGDEDDDEQEEAEESDDAYRCGLDDGEVLAHMTTQLHDEIERLGEKLAATAGEMEARLLDAAHSNGAIAGDDDGYLTEYRELCGALAAQTATLRDELLQMRLGPCCAMYVLCF